MFILFLFLSCLLEYIIYYNRFHHNIFMPGYNEFLSYSFSIAFSCPLLTLGDFLLPNYSPEYFHVLWVLLSNELNFGCLQKNGWGAIAPCQCPQHWGKCLSLFQQLLTAYWCFMTLSTIHEEILSNTFCAGHMYIIIVAVSSRIHLPSHVWKTRLMLYSFFQLLYFFHFLSHVTWKKVILLSH